MSLLLDKQFCRALDAYRDRWPGDGYHATRERFIATHSLLRRFYSGGTIVDIGGWPGDFACVLSSLDLPIVVVDKNPDRPTRKIRDEVKGGYVLDGTITLSEKCRQYGIEVVPCDIEREALPFADNSVAFLVCTEVIAHLRVGLLNALRELNRVLRPDGRLLLTTPNLLCFRNRLSFLFGRSEYDGLQLPYDALVAEERIGHGGIFRAFSMPELIDLLERTGFRLLYRGYHQLLTTQPNGVGWSASRIAFGIRNSVARCIRPLGNALFVAVEKVTD